MFFTAALALQPLFVRFIFEMTHYVVKGRLDLPHWFVCSSEDGASVTFVLGKVRALSSEPHPPSPFACFKQRLHEQ